MNKFSLHLSPVLAALITASLATLVQAQSKGPSGDGPKKGEGQTQGRAKAGPPGLVKPVMTDDFTKSFRR